MANTVTPTTPTVLSDPIAAESVASGSMGTAGVVNLLTKWSAKVFPRIGRTVATALTTATPPRIYIRKLHNGTATLHPSVNLDCVANVIACNATTLAGTVALGQTTGTLTTGTGFTAGDLVCLSSGASRTEFLRISKVASTTIVTWDSLPRVAHASGDTICNQADIFPPVTLEGGFEYEVRTDNGAGGQTCIFELLGESYDSDTIT